MNNEHFEVEMQKDEPFYGLHIPAGAHTVVRVDGHNFSHFTVEHFEKPFNPAFHGYMVQAAQTLLEHLGGLYAYCQSDEISLLLPRNWSRFDRSVETTMSLSAGIASNTFSKASRQPVRFDSHIWVGADVGSVVDYFRWRQSDAERCALNGWCYWSLRAQGQRARQATATLDERSREEKLALLREQGLDFTALPSWQRLGVGLCWESYGEAGFNPLIGKTTWTHSRRVRIDEVLPSGDDYAAYIQQQMEHALPVQYPLPVEPDEGRSALSNSDIDI
jgi:tRNA(His) guanylyltransferase